MSRQKLDTDPYPDFVFEIEYDQPPRRPQRKRRERMSPARRRKVAGLVVAVAALPGVAHYDGWTAGSENPIVQAIDAIGSVESDIMIAVTGAEDERIDPQAGSQVPGGQEADPDPTQTPGDEASEVPTASPTAMPPTVPIPKVLTYAHLSDPRITKVVSLSDALAKGAPIGKPDVDCQRAKARAVRTMGSMASGVVLDCWPSSQLAGGWNPQGVGGYDDVVSYSWYTKNALDTTLVKNGSERARLTLTQQNRYVNLELVQRCGDNDAQLCAVPTHTGGNDFLTSANRIYVGSKAGIYTFPADRVYMVGNKFLLLANGRAYPGCKSSSFSINDGRIAAVEYVSKKGQKTTMCSRAIGANGLPAGPVKKLRVKQRNMQGVAYVGGKWLLNSSRDDRVYRYSSNGRLEKSFQMPHENIEGIHIANGYYRTVTEHGYPGAAGRQINLTIGVPLNKLLR